MVEAVFVLITCYLFNGDHHAPTSDQGPTAGYSEAVNWQWRLRLVFGFPTTKGDDPVTGNYKPHSLRCCALFRYKEGPRAPDGHSENTSSMIYKKCTSAGSRRQVQGSVLLLPAGRANFDTNQLRGCHSVAAEDPGLMGYYTACSTGNSYRQFGQA